MRGQAAAVVDTGDNTFNEEGVPHFVKRKRMPGSRFLLRSAVFFFLLSLPVIKTWERDRGDSGFEKPHRAFPSATPRDLEHHSSEHQLIASGSMSGAHRTILLDRPKYSFMLHGERLPETHQPLTK